MSELPLGKIIDGEQQRDAIHIAVAPVVAAERLVPGGHIGFTGDSTEEVTARAKVLIGIVDPFLTAIVERGQRFWMFLYPQTITSLRHDWTHPAFKEVAVRVVGDQESADWIRSFATGHGVTYDDMMAAAKEWLIDREYFIRGGQFEGEYVPDEFWTHYERVTGTRVGDESRQSFFSCSC